MGDLVSYDEGRHFYDESVAPERKGDVRYEDKRVGGRRAKPRKSRRPETKAGSGEAHAFVADPNAAPEANGLRCARCGEPREHAGHPWSAP